MKLRINWLAAMVLAGLLAGCGGDEPGEAADEAVEEARAAKAASPDEAVEAAAKALENNDVKAFLVALMPPEELEKMEQKFDEERQTPPTEAERAEFAETMEKLTREGAEDELMAELEPQLDQMAAQMPMMIGFGQMMVSQGIQENQDLTQDQKQAAQSTATAVFTQLQSANLGDKETAREAIGIVTEYARKLDLKTADEVQALSFDEALGKAGIVMEGSKELLGLYGFDINAILGSVDAEIVSEEEDNATVMVSYDLFGQPQSAETTMVRIGNGWYGADLIEQLNKPEEAPAELEMMPDMAPESDEMEMEEEGADTGA
ncbi:MAG: hypothetical protein R3200_17830 [Xanthomonadales bacterium]|nr:hypothetical protein [Xanthomonadales bacterium]